MILGCVLCLPAALKLQHASGMSAAVVRMISAQSYALYLIHETVLLEVQSRLWGPGLLGTFPSMVIAVVLPFLLSFLTLHLFEAPILSHRPAQRLARGGPGASAVLSRPPTAGLPVSAPESNAASPPAAPGSDLAPPAPGTARTLLVGHTPAAPPADAAPASSQPA